MRPANYFIAEEDGVTMGEGHVDVEAAVAAGVLYHCQMPDGKCPILGHTGPGFVHFAWAKDWDDYDAAVAAVTGEVHARAPKVTTHEVWSALGYVLVSAGVALAFWTSVIVLLFTFDLRWAAMAMASSVASWLLAKGFKARHPNIVAAVDARKAARERDRAE